MRNAFQPTSDEVAQGTRFSFQIAMGAGGSTGAIDRESEKVVWRYFPSSVRPAFSRHNPLRERHTLFAETDGPAVLEIRRVVFSPPTFEMVEDGATVGRITLRSVLRNRYRIELEPDQTWDFRMPLFASEFYGTSSSGSRVFARVATNLTRWIVLAEPRGDTRLLCALAFIHNRAWNSG
jgi:hypothetical protein